MIIADYRVLESETLRNLRKSIGAWTRRGYTLMGPVTVYYAPYKLKYLATMECPNVETNV